MTGSINTDETEQAQTLNADPDFSEIGEEFGAGVEADLERMWTCVHRGVESRFFDLTPEEAIAAHEIYIAPDEHLTGDEIHDLELFTSALGKCRSPLRSYENLTAVEHSILRILRRAARRRLEDGEGDN